MNGADDSTPQVNSTEGGAYHRIGVGSNDDAVVRFQLAARWAETFAPHTGDTLERSLQRFRVAYEYLEAVMHGIEPSPFELPQAGTASSVAPAPGSGEHEPSTGQPGL